MSFGLLGMIALQRDGPFEGYSRIGLSSRRSPSNRQPRRLAFSCSIPPIGPVTMMHIRAAAAFASRSREQHSPNRLAIWLPLVTLLVMMSAWTGRSVAADGASLATRPTAPQPTTAATDDRPNILWISAEDISPDLGPYGDAYSSTPVLDRFAAESLRFTRCFTHAGVCAPSRSGLITGMYPNSIGTHHMRCQAVPSPVVKCFPEWLRAAGYYCTNNSKTDYQFAAPKSAWDANGPKADWTGRKPGQPFFSVINLTTTHESQIRDPSPLTKKLVGLLTAAEQHGTHWVPLPPYYPDTPVVRRDVARYYDLISAMSGQVQHYLEQLERDGLADNTIVWFWGDHGRGLPRSKRWLYDSGTRVPLLIRTPPRYRQLVFGDRLHLAKPGVVCDDLVAFVDFAPTMLSLCGVPLPEHLQGQPFLGPEAKPPRQYVYGHRDRMDETTDLIRSVRDQRYRYIRNFRPDLPRSQRIAYMDQMPTMQDWRRLHAAGELNGPAADWFAARKPLEELYDTEQDRHEVRNLADDPTHRETLLRLRSACREWMLSIHDLGLVPEPILDDWQRPAARGAHVIVPTVQAERMPGDMPTWHVSATVNTPGTSLSWVLLPPEVERITPKTVLPWQLMTGPVKLHQGQRLALLAERLGYRDAPLLTVTATSDGVVDVDPATPSPDASSVDESQTLEPDWTAQYQQSGLLTKLLEFHDRALPHQTTTLSSTQLAELDRQDVTSHEAALRYWAVWRTIDQTPQDGWTESVISMLLQRRDHDPSPAVRIIAAEGLALHHDVTANVERLGQELNPKQQPHASARLQAMTALRRLGAQALPLLPEIRSAADDGEYVGRVATDWLSEFAP
jgi:N-sulfoglucosamine sulfohydrolase